MCIKLVALHINRYTGSTVARSFDNVGDPWFTWSLSKFSKFEPELEVGRVRSYVCQNVSDQFRASIQNFFIFVSSFHTVLRYLFHRFHTVYIRFIASHGFEKATAIRKLPDDGVALKRSVIAPDYLLVSNNGLQTCFFVPIAL